MSNFARASTGFVLAIRSALDNPEHVGFSEVRNIQKENEGVPFVKVQHVLLETRLGTHW